METVPGDNLRRVRSIGIVGMVLLATLLPADGALGTPPSPSGRYVVGFHGPPPLQEGDLYHGGTVMRVNTVINFAVVETDDGDRLLSEAATDERVRYIHPDILLDAPLIVVPDGPPGTSATDGGLGFPRGSPPAVETTTSTPNDPQYNNFQWNLRQIRANEAWDVTTGTTQASVCVVDTGVRHTHEDLTARWRGGYNAEDNTNNADDYAGHGTHVAGIAAATIGNGRGIAGIGNIGLYAARIPDIINLPWSSQVAEAITWCADQVPRTVINISHGCEGLLCDVLYVLSDAANYAYYTKGQLLVASAGNDGPCSDCVDFPATLPTVIAVTSTDPGEGKSSFSSAGSEAELAAPGNQILSTVVREFPVSVCGGGGVLDYAHCSGTSMSAPHVSGVAALVWSHHTGLTNVQLRECLRTTAQDLGPSGRDSDFGYGEVDAKAAMDCNDYFASPIAIGSAPFVRSQSTTKATSESGEPSPCGDIGATVWYKFTAPTDGRLYVNTYGSGYDTVLALYTGGSLGSLQNIACNDDSNAGIQSEVSVAATAGTTYWIQAGGASGAKGSLALFLNHIPNDDAANALVIGPAPVEYVQPNTLGATTEWFEPVPCGGTNTVWYEFTAPNTGTLTIDTFGSSFDTVLSIYTGVPPWDLNSVACNDNQGGLQSQVSFTATSGTTYRIQVGGSTVWETGQLLLQLQLVDNDDRAGAVSIPSVPYTNTQNTWGFTLDPDEPTVCAGVSEAGTAFVGSTAWYKIKPGSPGLRTANTFGSDFDTVLAVYVLAGDTLTQIACNDDSVTDGLLSSVAWPATAGTTYWLQAGGYAGQTGGGTGAQGTLVLNVG